MFFCAQKKSVVLQQLKSNSDFLKKSGIYTQSQETSNNEQMKIIALLQSLLQHLTNKLHLAHNVT